MPNKWPGLIRLSELFLSDTVDLISIDRRSLEKEAECLERTKVLAAQFTEKVKNTGNFMWKSEEHNTEGLDNNIIR